MAGAFALGAVKDMRRLWSDGSTLCSLVAFYAPNLIASDAIARPARGGGIAGAIDDTEAAVMFMTAGGSSGGGLAFST